MESKPDTAILRQSVGNAPVEPGRFDMARGARDRAVSGAWRAVDPAFAPAGRGVCLPVIGPGAVPVSAPIVGHISLGRQAAIGNIGIQLSIIQDAGALNAAIDTVGAEIIKAFQPGGGNQFHKIVDRGVVIPGYTRGFVVDIKSSIPG